MAYKSKVNKMLRGVQLTNKRPWALQADGDLWQMLEKIIKSKGKHALRVTWCKGHANQKHIDSGITTATHKAGNDEADLLADRGVAAHAEGLGCLVNFYLSKQHRATLLLTRLYKMFHRVLLREHELREAGEKGAR